MENLQNFQVVFKQIKNVDFSVITECSDVALKYGGTYVGVTTTDLILNETLKYILFYISSPFILPKIYVTTHYNR